jgi:hypothetical protein
MYTILEVMGCKELMDKNTSWNNLEECFSLIQSILYKTNMMRTLQPMQTFLLRTIPYLHSVLQKKMQNKLQTRHRE